MPLSPAERRFLRNWEEQRQGGKASFVGIYTFGYFIFIFMCGVALGLFSGLRLVNGKLLITWAIISAVGAVLAAFVTWRRFQQKFQAIVRREVAEGEANANAGQPAQPA
ncbi:MAG: hypothetical protein MUF62_13220 [Chitinophagaceae bacterium]|jgi:peptidoglycan/LPS O-acetylase OafA/YrhL|nr:hypothetical protein [Chitinophagaceae bacterium]